MDLQGFTASLKEPAPPPGLSRALEALSPAERQGAERFLRGIIDASEREKVARLIGR